MYTLVEDAGPYWAGDLPPAYVSEIELDGEALDLQAGDVVTAGLTGPDGAEVIPSAARQVDVDADTFSMQLRVDDASPFTVAGVYQLTATVAGVRADPLRIVVEDADGWHTLATARKEWRDLPQDAVVAYELLQTARRDVEAFARPLPAGAPVPAHYRQAQVMHARDIRTANVADPASGDEGGSFATTPYPLDWMVKQVLRPKRARPGLVQ